MERNSSQYVYVYQIITYIVTILKFCQLYVNKTRGEKGFPRVTSLELFCYKMLGYSGKFFFESIIHHFHLQSTKTQETVKGGGKKYTHTHTSVSCVTVSLFPVLFETKVLNFKCTHGKQSLQTNTQRGGNQNMSIA